MACGALSKGGFCIYAWNFSFLCTGGFWGGVLGRGGALGLFLTHSSHKRSQSTKKKKPVIFSYGRGNWDGLGSDIFMIYCVCLFIFGNRDFFFVTIHMYLLFGVYTHMLIFHDPMYGLREGLMGTRLGDTVRVRIGELFSLFFFSWFCNKEIQMISSQKKKNDLHWFLDVGWWGGKERKKFHHPPPKIEG